MKSQTSLIASQCRLQQPVLGAWQCALQGLEIIQVEILSGKELTTPLEVSFELLVVTLVAKRKQQDSRDSYWAPKYQYTRRAIHEVPDTIKL